MDSYTDLLQSLKLWMRNNARSFTKLVMSNKIVLFSFSKKGNGAKTPNEEDERAQQALSQAGPAERCYFMTFISMFVS